MRSLQTMKPLSIGSTPAVGRHDLVGVRVATEAVLGLVEGDVALALQDVGGGEPGDSRSDHCHGRPVHGTPSCLRAECSRAEQDARMGQMP